MPTASVVRPGCIWISRLSSWRFISALPAKSLIAKNCRSRPDGPSAYPHCPTTYNQKEGLIPHEKAPVLRVGQCAARPQRRARGVAGILPALLFLQSFQSGTDLHLLGRLYPDL